MSIRLKFTYRGKSKNKFKDFSARLKADRVKGEFDVNSCSKTIGDLKEFIIENSKLNKLKNFSKGQIQLYYNNKPVKDKDDQKILTLSSQCFGLKMSDFVADKIKETKIEWCVTVDLELVDKRKYESKGYLISVDICKSIGHLKKLAKSKMDSSFNMFFWVNNKRLDTNDTMPLYKALEQVSWDCNNNKKIDCWDESNQESKDRQDNESKNLHIAIKNKYSERVYDIDIPASDDVITLKTLLLSKLSLPNSKNITPAQLEVTYDGKILDNTKPLNKCIPYKELSKFKLIDMEFSFILSNSNNINNKLTNMYQEIENNKGNFSELQNACLAFIENLQEVAYISLSAQVQLNNIRDKLGFGRLRKNWKSLLNTDFKPKTNNQTNRYLLSNCKFSDSEIKCLSGFKNTKETLLVEQFMKKYNTAIENVSKVKKSKKY